MSRIKSNLFDFIRKILCNQIKERDLFKHFAELGKENRAENLGCVLKEPLKEHGDMFLYN